jgi:anti-anti-sigma factor
MVNVELRTRAGGGYVVVPRGELDTAGAEKPASGVAALAEGGQQLIIDLEAPDYIDCPALGASLRARDTTRRAGGNGRRARGLPVPRVPCRRVPGAG